MTSRKSKSGKSVSSKRNLGKGKMKKTKGGLIGLLNQQTPTANTQTGLLLPAVKTGILPYIQPTG